MTQQVLLIMLEKAFHSVHNFEKDEDIVKAFKFILDKAVSVLRVTNAQLSEIENLSPKQLKKEKNKLKLNKKIKKEVDSKIDVLNQNLETKVLVAEYIKEYTIYLHVLREE